MRPTRPTKMNILACTATPLFYQRQGALQQRLDITLALEHTCELELMVADADARAETHVHAAPVDGVATVVAFAPYRDWRTGTARSGLLTIQANGETCLTHDVCIGSFRPWTIHVLSDVCADDVWAYDDVVRHDYDDYLTTLAELRAGNNNAYNLPAARQLERFLFHARLEERELARAALQDKRLFVSMIPNQLNPAAFLLSVYPELLTPYRRVMEMLGLDPAACADAAYHMEGPTWTLGLAKLLHAAGVKLFAKSLLRYQAPWIERLARLPRLTRYEVAPGQYCLFSLHCNGYGEAGWLIDDDLAKVNRLLHEELLPTYERPEAAYPSALLPLAGMYGDLAPHSPGCAAAKLAAIARYNAQGWAYPRIVNSTWAQFAAALAEECARPEQPSRQYVIVRGDAGASWEGWMMAAQNEHAQFRGLQRRMNAIHTLHALLPGLDLSAEALDAITLDVVHLGDHAWNGFDAGTWNASIYVRRRRIAAAEKRVAEVWEKIDALQAGDAATRYAVVNTLGWARNCDVEVPRAWGDPPPALHDPATGEQFEPVGYADGVWRYLIPTIPAFGARLLEQTPSHVSTHDAACAREALLAMRPVMYMNSQEVAIEGGWRAPDRGEWTIGNLSLIARVELLESETQRLFIHISGIVPDGSYELSWLMKLPWETCTWLLESGGAFITPGAVARGGDSLEGVIGCVSVVGEGMQAIGPDGGAILFAFNETGICGLGRRSTTISLPRSDNQPLDADAVPYQDTLQTSGKLYWFLLGSELNGRESYKQQMGAHHWTFHCTLQRADHVVTPADLYRFACGANRPAALIPAAAWPHGAHSALVISGSREVVPLGLRRRGAQTEINLFNCSAAPVRVTLEGPLTQHASLFDVTMLGGAPQRLPGNYAELPPQNFHKLLLLPT